MQLLNTRSNATRFISSCLALLCIATCSANALGDWREDIGYNKLLNFLGDAAPNGSGVPISLVEARAAGGGQPIYFPNVSSSRFNASDDPLGIAVTFTDGSGGQSNGVSGHSNSQAETFFGNTTSVAPAANAVTVYEANDFLTDILGINGSNSDPPDRLDFRVQNFSWIGTFATPNDGTPEPTSTELNNDREALRRLDYAIEVDNITAVVGLNNNLAILPSFFSHSYNSIAVGLTNGDHSTGLTHLANYGVGRSKPDLVGPATFTSTATSLVSSTAAFLHSSDTVLGTDAAQSETMKAILLAGATKTEFASWSQIDSSGNWHPLDDTYGAGQVNLYNSYLSTLGGQFAGSSTTPTQVGSHGWDYQTVQPGTENELLYDFVIPTGSTAEELSIVLTWNAQISSPFHTGNPVVADLNLELVNENGDVIDFLPDDELVDGLSNSDVDNVEHLYLTDLMPGTYTLKVSSEDLVSDFGLAWRTATLFDTPSTDFDNDGDTDGVDFLRWQRGFGTLLGATRVNGDADGDGDVDADDLVLLDNALSADELLLSSAVLAVPEPTSWALAGAGLMIGILTFRHHRRMQTSY